MLFEIVAESLHGLLRAVVVGGQEIAHQEALPVVEPFEVGLAQLVEELLRAHRVQALQVVGDPYLRRRELGVELQGAGAMLQGLADIELHLGLEAELEGLAGLGGAGGPATVAVAASAQHGGGDQRGAGGEEGRDRRPSHEGTSG